MLTRFLCLTLLSLSLQAQHQLKLPDGNLLLKTNGEIARLTGGNGREIVRGGELWRLHFRDGTPKELGAREFVAQGGRLTVADTPNSLILNFDSPELALTIRLQSAAERGLEIRAEVRKTNRDILQIEVPELYFDAANLERFVFPQKGNSSLGMAFTKKFFLPHQEGNGKLEYEVIGPRIYQELFGGGLDQRPDNDAEVKPRVTEIGREWIPASRIGAIERREFCINRPPAKGQFPLVLIDSDSGPVVAGANFGGSGWLFRFSSRTGGRQREREAVWQQNILRSISEKALAQRSNRQSGKQLVLLAPFGSPVGGSWTATLIPEWEELLENSPLLRHHQLEFKVARTPAEVAAALDPEKTAMVVNPFGETMPVGSAKDWKQTAAKLRDYVRRGGIWWELGGYPFYRVFKVNPYSQYSVSYPTAVADFMHLQSAESALAVFGVQPISNTPWAGRDNPAVRLNIASLNIGSNAQGAWLRHGWKWLVKAGETHHYPVLKLLPDIAVKPAMALYKESLGLDRTLAQKVPSRKKLETIKGALLIRAGARTAAEHRAMLPQIPPASIFHYTEYLHGGFDKQYPDHLPVREGYGTAEDFMELHRQAQSAGHLMMPYTNTSWWCIDPKGPTFERVGDAALLRKLDGSLSLERYAKNAGYSCCYWHPETIAAHRRTRKQMTEIFPSDILFQDQVGARGFRWDTNPAAPYATAFHEGLHSLTMEDAEHVPVATEDGYDRVAQFETILCGMAWSTIPAGGHRKTSHNRFHFAAGEWEFFPILGYLAHEQAIFTAHDLGHFITDHERLAYALAFGYSLTHRTQLSSLRQPAHRRWMFWLDAVQKTICANYAGKPLLDFGHPLAQHPGEHLDVMLTRYPGLTIVANIGNRPLPVSSLKLPEFSAFAGETIAGPGFLAIGESVQAGVLVNKEGGNTSFARDLSSTSRQYLMAPAGSTLPAPLAKLQEGNWKSCPGGQPTKPLQMAVKKENLMPAKLAKLAPTAWEKHNREILVLAFPDAPTSWTEVDAAAWETGIRQSQPLRDAGFTVRGIKDPAAFAASLAGPPEQRPFAIINPGGECFYGPFPDAEKTLALMTNYVRNGGIWYETGGYSFYIYCYPNEKGEWQKKNIGPSGARQFAFNCTGTAVDDPPRKLNLTATGKAWFTPEQATAITATPAGVQRAFTKEAEALSLIDGDGDGFLGATRGNGWGWFWRLGGFRPPASVALPAVVGTLESLATKPWPEEKPSSIPQLWTIE